MKNTDMPWVLKLYLQITQACKINVVCIFVADCIGIWCADSKNDHHFALSRNDLSQNGEKF
jgi:hypothetical protein